MTKAPKSIDDLADFWVKQGGRNLGIVGDTKHKQRGVSYHLGSDDLAAGAYSATLKRDRKPTLAASALDLGKLDGRIGRLRRFSNWLVNQAQAGKTPDIREIIWSPDGIDVRRWDEHLDEVIVSLRRHPDNTVHVVHPGNGDATHYRHTHISFYRDSEFDPKVQFFQGFFAKPLPKPKPGDEPEPDPDDDVDPTPGDEGDPDADIDIAGQTPGAQFVTVKPSPDPRSTLSGIAHEFGTTVAHLLAFPENAKYRKDPGKLFKGQLVRVR